MYLFFSSYNDTDYEYQQSACVHKFSNKTRSHLRNSRHRNGDMKQVPHCGPTDIRRSGTKFRRPGEPAFGVCAPVG
jgi:hypothetical protein